MKGKIDKLEFIKIKNFCSARGTLKRIKRQVTDGEKYLQNAYLIKEGLYPKFIRNS